MKWISIEERLPEHYQRVLVGRAGAENVMKIVVYEKEFGLAYWGRTMDTFFADPTHWMPLPKEPPLPKGGK